MKRSLPVFFLLFFSSFSSFAQWDDIDLPPAAVYANRRAALRDLLPDSSIAVFFANPVRNRSNDVDFQYSQDPNFYYLSGCTEPNAVLLILKLPRNIDGKDCDELIFVQNRAEKKELWNGKRMGPEGAQRISGIQASFNATDFDDFGLDWSKFAQILCIYPESPNQDLQNEADLADLVSQFQLKIDAEKHKIERSLLRRIMGQLREVKGVEELVMMQKAIDATAEGFKEMMRSIQPGATEYQAQAIVEYFMKKKGCEYQGYPSIAGSGSNACVLHYTFNRKTLGSGDLLLCDMGGEYHGYTADITRTFPVNGKFSPEQRQIYELVLFAQNAGIKACRAGEPFLGPHEAAKKAISDGLISLGILKDASELSRYFMHGTSHYLGLEVHDAGTKGVLKPGNVITVEPGIYIPAGSPCDSKWWNIGVRIEDDILITDRRPENLSESIPRTVREIEKLMQEDGDFK